MPDRFTGTMLTKINTQGGLPEDPAKAFGKMSEETDKALLDILKKVNETSASAADAATTAASITGINSAMAAAIKGMKYGLDVSYVSADVLSISPGAVEVNGEIVSIDAPLAITASMPNFPAAGAWAFVTMERGGTHRLFPATGTAAQRPTDNCFQWTGGGVGFLDLGKQGYYYDPARRIIGAVHKVNATTWYIICQGAGIIESGSNANGNYRKGPDGTMDAWGVFTITMTGIYNYTSSPPVNFEGTPVSDASITPTAHWNFITRGSQPAYNSISCIIENFGASQTAYVNWRAIGRWRA